jgi:hypothetical protein
VNIETSFDNNTNFNSQKLTSKIIKNNVADLFDTGIDEYFVMVIAKHKEDISLNNDIFKEYETLCVYKNKNKNKNEVEVETTNIIKKDSMRPIIITKNQNAPAEAGTTGNTGPTSTPSTSPSSSTPLPPPTTGNTGPAAGTGTAPVGTVTVEGHVEVVENDKRTAFSTIDTFEFIKKMMSLLMKEDDIAKNLFFESNSDSLMKKNDLVSLFSDEVVDPGENQAV